MIALIEMLGDKRDGLALLGALVALYIILRATCSLWSGLKQYLLANFLGVNVKSLGTWAVVTGSTDGIGKAYAEALAKAGLNLVLISRSQLRLNSAAKQIERKYGVKTKMVAVDFSGGTEIYSRIASELSGMDIGVLVNNVGVAYDDPYYLHELADKNVQNIIIVNCLSVAAMSKVVLPGMLDKRKGAIINISSAAGAKKTPLLSVYSAAKAYVVMLSECMAGEYEPKGIHIQCVAPGMVVTKMSQCKLFRIQESIVAPMPDAYVRSALPTLGVTSFTYGYYAHALQMLIFKDMLPDWLYLRLSMNFSLAARDKGLQLNKKQDNTEI